MKKLIAGCLCVFMAFFSSPAFPDNKNGSESIDDLASQDDALYRTGAAAHDGAYTALSASMIGWGLALTIAIGIIAALLSQDSTSNGHSHCD